MNNRLYPKELRWRKEAMTQSVLVKLDLPKDWKKFRMPRALHDRLQELLDRQDRDGKLSSRERREAGALTELADMLSAMRLRAEVATKRRQPPRELVGAFPVVR
jgi:hypothetical protein